MLYVKKPIPVEAIRWTEDTEAEVAKFCPIAVFCFSAKDKISARQRGNSKHCFSLIRPKYLEIPTPSGIVQAVPGNYIVRDADNIYSVYEKADFEEKFSPTK